MNSQGIFFIIIYIRLGVANPNQNRKFFIIWNFFPATKKTSFLCKVNFSRQIFLLYFGKGNFGGKKFTLQQSEFTLQSRFFVTKWQNDLKPQYFFINFQNSIQRLTWLSTPDLNWKNKKITIYHQKFP